MPSRDATTHWEGDLMTGKGAVTLDSSNAGVFPVSFPTRAGEPDGQTSPEELIAAAHSSCFAMALSNELATAGTPAASLDVSAEVTLDRIGGEFAITTIVLTVEASVPGMDDAAFQTAAAAAKAGCPVSKALTGVAEISLVATLRG
jgi:osmotically inducible protein OsmC